MASRVKKFFHRTKDDSTEDPRYSTRAPATARSDPAMRTSLYESTTAGRPPQTGDYSIKGNDSSVVFQADRKSSIRSLRSRRSSSRGSQYNNQSYRTTAPHHSNGTREAPHVPPQSQYAAAPGSYDPYQDVAIPTSGQEDRRRRWSSSSLSQDFVGLKLGDSQC